MSKESITKYGHKVLAEQSIYDFIEFLEQEARIPNEHKEWLLKKGEEIFETYYLDGVITVNLTSEEDKFKLEEYLNQVKERLGKMFAHIMLSEYKLYLLSS